MAWLQRNWLFAVWLFFLIGRLFLPDVRGRRRTALGQQLCADHSWVFLGRNLPTALRRCQQSDRSYRRSNTCEAVVCGVVTYVADLSIRRGKRTVSQTIFCFDRKAGNRLRSALFSASFHYEYVDLGSWLDLYQDSIAVDPEDWKLTCESLLSLIT